jgi:hypothetical protein
MLSEQSQIGYVSKRERDFFSRKLIMLDETPKTQFRRNKLIAYDAEDKYFGTTKESRLSENQSIKLVPIVPEKHKTNDKKSKRIRKEKMIIEKKRKD